MGKKKEHKPKHMRRENPAIRLRDFLATNPWLIAIVTLGDVIQLIIWAANALNHLLNVLF